MAKLWTWFLATATHAGAVGTLAFVAAHAGPTAAPNVPVASSDGLCMEVEFSIAEPEFISMETSKTAPMSSAEIVPEFELEPREIVQWDERAFAPQKQPAPSFDRPLAPTPMGSTCRTDAVEICNPPPEFPPSARRRLQEGEVQVEVVVGTDGTCTESRIVQSRGGTCFEQAVLRALTQWKYRPAMRDGRPVPSTHRIRFVFRLQG